MRGVKHDPQVKGAAMAALLTGQGVDKVATDYKLPVTTVKTWKRQAAKRQAEALQAKAEAVAGAPADLSDTDGYEVLLDRYIVANLRALIAQQGLFADESYLRKYPPDKLAVLHGISADKVIRLLEAVERADAEDAGPLEPVDAPETQDY